MQVFKCHECEGKEGPFHKGFSFFGKPVKVCEKCFEEFHEQEKSPKQK